MAHLSHEPPAQPLAVLRRYHHLIAAQLARNSALVEHAGTIDDALLRTIEIAFARNYQRPITASARPNPDLIAGLRIRIGDDVYESSIASQLAGLSGAA